MALRAAKRNSAPINGLELKGKVSWFGGPKDSTDSGHTALGLTTATPGIAVYNEATLGGYWLVTFENGHRHVFRQTDIGPAPWTKRVVDVTYSALGEIGYSEGDFPTDSQVTAVYLGKDKQAAETKGGTDPVGRVEEDTTGKRANAGLIKSLIPGAGGNLTEDLLTGNSQDAAFQMAQIGLHLLRDIGIGIIDLIVAPAWHWNQRTVATYSNYVLSYSAHPNTKDSSLQWALPWTAAFWGLGYALLWTDLGNGTGLKPVSPHKSTFARHIRRGQAVPARQSLIKPHDVKRKTPKKPQTTESKAAILQIHIMEAERPRTVRVNTNASAKQSTTSETDIKRVRLEKDGTIARVPHPPTNTRKGAPKDSGAATKGVARKGARGGN